MGNWITLGDWGIVNLDTVKAINAGNGGHLKWVIVMDYLDDHQQTYVFDTEMKRDYMYNLIRQKCGLSSNIVPPELPPPAYRDNPYDPGKHIIDYSWINSIKKWF